MTSVSIGRLLAIDRADFWRLGNRAHFKTA
jgi:hypothetical protein